MSIKTPWALIQALLTRWRALREHSDDPEAEQAAELDLVAAVARTPSRALYDNDDLLRDILAAIGGVSPLLLETAIRVLGVTSTKADSQVAELLRQAASVDAGVADCAKAVARTIGIDGDGDDALSVAFARMAIKTGEIDALLRQILALAGHAQGVRDSLARLLVLPPPPRKKVRADKRK